MTKKLFTKKEQEQLKCNPNVQAVSEKAITYTDAFKRHFIAENEKGKVIMAGTSGKIGVTVGGLLEISVIVRDLSCNTN